jgi:hypothetical protein
MVPGAAPDKPSSAPARSLRRRLAPQAIKELVARYNAGEETPALSREYDISKNGLRQLLLAEGVSLRRQAITLEDVERAVQLYQSGLTIRQVVEQVGYSYGTIRGALHENGVAMRAGGAGGRLAAEKRL